MAFPHRILQKLNRKNLMCSKKKLNAQARNRTGGPTMATLDFTTKPLALNVLMLMGWKPDSLYIISVFWRWLLVIHSQYVL